MPFHEGAAGVGSTLALAQGSLYHMQVVTEQKIPNMLNFNDTLGGFITYTK